MVTTLSEWKRRLTVGTHIQQTWRKFQWEGTPRIFEVSAVQTNGIWVIDPSIEAPQQRRMWIPFPKRHEIEFTEQGWKRIEKGEPISEYMWLGAAYV